MYESLEKGLAMTSETARPWWTASKEYVQQWEVVAKEARVAQARGDHAKAEAAMGEIVRLRQATEKEMEKIVEFNEERMAAAHAGSAATYRMATIQLISISAALIFVISLIAFFVLRSTSRTIQKVISHLHEGSDQVSAAAHQIASASEELSQAATEQAASLEQTAASIEEMNSMINKNSENANSASTTSRQSQDVVHNGQDVIQKMVQAMEAINKSSEGMAETVSVIEQIDKETKVINDIVNKTELLSFNASVEAARAGEHGKGFAVVAEEVGNLARMSGVAAEKISTLLEESLRKVNQMVQDTKSNVQTGTQVTQECGEVFDQIVQNVNSVTNIASEIASASQEQARGSAEITKAMTQLDQMTQQNAATSEECASAAEELSAQSESLKGAVTQLVHAINGSNGESSIDYETPSKTGHTKQNSKVVPLKKSGRPSGGSASAMTRHNSSPTVLPLQKASGDAPSYDSEGFRDV
ncbi:MAG: methyl-accepting chemotaxis protein [Bdellovibrionales bacterium]|nr:methyl-accepting chemotaxis protein [Bdellovibrionales bacterium]